MEDEKRLIALEAMFTEVDRSIGEMQKVHTLLSDQLRSARAVRGGLTSEIFRVKKALGYPFTFCIRYTPGPKKKPCNDCGECGVRAQ